MKKSVRQKYAEDKISFGVRKEITDMNKKIISAMGKAVICGMIAAAIPMQSFAAAAANKAVLLDVSAGTDILTAETEFTDGVEGWTVSGGSAEAVDGAMNVDFSGSSAAVSTSIDSALYRSAASEGMYWDFETDDDFTSNIDADTDADIAKWTSVRAYTDIYTGEAANAETYNVGYKEATGANTNVTKPDSGVTEAIPAAGSERCLVVENTAAWKGYMGARVRLSKSTFKAGETYTMSFWMTQNSQQRPIYIGITPYSEEELSVNTASAVQNGIIDYENAEKNRLTSAAVRQWTQYTTTLSPTNEDFNDDGYATLWILTLAPTITNKADIFLYEKFYLDNVSIERESNEAWTSSFGFSMKVRGKAGQQVTALVEVDGNDELFSVSQTISKDDTWESVTKDFSVASDNALFKNKSEISPFTTGNDRAVLELKISGGDSVEIDEVHLLKKADAEKMRENAGSTMYFIVDVFGLESVDKARIEMKNGSKSILKNANFPLEVGRQTLTMKGTMPSGLSGNFTFNLYKSFTQIMEKEQLIFPVFKNGNNIYPNTELVKYFGKGTYLVEFDVESGTADDTATVRIGTKEASADVFDDGKAVAELVMTDSDISAIDSASSVTIECEKTTSNVTVKKVAD